MQSNNRIIRYNSLPGERSITERIIFRIRWLFRTSHKHWCIRYLIDKLRVIHYIRNNPDMPWFTEDANKILTTILRPSDVGLEWGTGRSTLFFANNVLHLTSVEENSHWYNAIKQQLVSNNITNVDYRCINPKSKQYIDITNTFKPHSLDFVSVDGNKRDCCAYNSINLLKPGGILIVDNINKHLPCNSIAPCSRSYNDGPLTRTWGDFLLMVKEWRLIWTTDKVKDTVIWIKP